ncbi:MAG: DUF2807 domain-containing protein [Oscillospiraceae bacterium]|nr:DUF2807 domain-containing protein [Oscillospiraceae bacterium]
MKKILGLVLVAGLVLALGGCATMRFAGHTTVRGNREVTTQATYIDVAVGGAEGPFSLEFRGFSIQNFTPVLIIDERLADELGAAVVVETDENLLEHIHVFYTGRGMISIRSDDNTRLFPSQLRISIGLPIDELRAGGAWQVTVNCTRVEDFRANLSGAARGEFQLGEVNRLELTGSGSSRLTVRADAEDARITLSGSARANLNGSTERMDLRVSGSGSMNAFGFAAQRVEVNVSGSGSADVYAAEEIDARASGSGRVTYAGDPTTMRQSTSGSARIRAR